MAVANDREDHGLDPPAYLADDRGRPAHCWRVLIFPSLERRDLYDRYRFDEPRDGPHNRALVGEPPATYALPARSGGGPGVTDYLAIVGPRTILVVAGRGAGILWAEPGDLSFATMPAGRDDPAGIGSPYQAPAVAIADGTVVRLDVDPTPDLLRAWLTADGGEPLRREQDGMTAIDDGRSRPSKGP